MSTRSGSALVVLCLLSLLSARLAAQVAQPAKDADGPQHPGFSPAATMRAFTAQSSDWHVRWDLARGVPEFVFGGQRATVPAGSGDAAFEAAARSVVNELAGALGFDSDVLQLQRVKRIALAQQGSSDKVAVKFQQVTQGVPTWRGTVNVLFSADGKLLAVDNLALPHAAETVLDATNTADLALRAAQQAFARDTDKVAVSSAMDGYVLFPARVAPGKDAVRAAPAYLFKLAAERNPLSPETPVIREYAVAARGAPDVLGSWSLVHNADITGDVSGWGQTDYLADGWSPDVLHALKDVRLTAAGGPTVFSDDAGHFVMANQASPLLVTATLQGQFSSVINAAGSPSAIAFMVNPGAPQAFTFNAGLTEQETAEVNAHTAAERMRDWLKSLDPTETTLDFTVPSSVNQSSLCNAFYDGVSLNFFLSGGGCPNSAYSTVCWHEEGHWLNDLYGSGNGFDGFGEGAADCWSMYLSDQPIIAANFFGVGIPIRTGENTTAFCGDNSPGCYGEPHADGEPLMGAIWKVRKHLKATLGDVAGGDLANHLLLSWFQVFDDSMIKSVIEDHWLALDDDDGNINNGTPHYPAIDQGFKDQNFPGFVLPLFQITHAPLTLLNTEDPVGISCNVEELNGQLDGVSAFFTTNGGQSFTELPMVHGPGTSWSCELPGTPSPAVVGYYLRASESGGNGNTLPKKAPGEFFAYDVGTVTIHAFNNFEGVTDEGWTHQLIVKQDDWQHGPVFGGSLDPQVAYSGTRVWGNDLGPTGWNGEYQPDVSNALLSPVFDLSGATNTRLRFRRWLSVEKGIYDHAEVFVNGVNVYTNPAQVDQVDSSWVFQDFDISALADNNPTVQVKFTLITDPGVEMGGWTLDDFAIVSLDPVSPGFSEYGAGMPGFGGLAPHLTGSGDTSLGGVVSMTVANGRPNASGAMFLGTTQVQQQSTLGTFLVGNVIGAFELPLNAGGTVTTSGTLPTDPGAVGVTITSQYWCIDPESSTGYAGSNGLTFTVQ